jgi:hypothetical protein
MKYFTNIDFAARTLKLYYQLREKAAEYDFTFAAGTLLNVFTAICPVNNKYEIDILPLLNKPFPYAPGQMPEGDLMAYLGNIRNALAHKTEGNFCGNDDGKEKISELHLSSDKNPGGIYLNLDDLEKILCFLKEAIELHYQNEWADTN